MKIKKLLTILIVSTWIGMPISSASALDARYVREIGLVTAAGGIGAGWLTYALKLIFEPVPISAYPEPPVVTNSLLRGLVAAGGIMLKAALATVFIAI